MAATRLISGVLREVWREPIAQDGGTSQLLLTDIACDAATIARLQPFLQLDSIVGVPDFRNSTFAIVNGKLQINIVNSAAPGNSATWVLDVTLNHSLQQAKGVAAPVLLAFFAGFPSAVWVPAARVVAAGNGLVGGGDLSADRTFAVQAADNSINVGPTGIRTKYAYVEKTAAYLITVNDYTINCTANTFPVTLPTAFGIVGRMYVIKNSGNGIITVNTTGGEFIDGVLTATLNPDDAITVQSTNSGWIII